MQQALDGASQVTGVTPLRAAELKVATSGATKIRLQVEAKHLVVDSSGGSNLNLSGRCVKVAVKMHGSSDLEAGDLLAEEYEIKASGSSDLSVHASRRLEADLSGSSEVRYRGSPRVTVEASGSSRVKAL